MTESGCHDYQFENPGTRKAYFEKNYKRIDGIKKKLEDVYGKKTIDCLIEDVKNEIENNTNAIVIVDNIKKTYEGVDYEDIITIVSAINMEIKQLPREEKETH